MRTLLKQATSQIALHFVQDKNTRFELAIECGNLDVASDMAKEIDRPECWERLAQQALKQGNHKVRRPREVRPHIVDQWDRSSRRLTSKPKISTDCPSFI